MRNHFHSKLSTHKRIYPPIDPHQPETRMRSLLWFRLSEYMSCLVQFHLFCFGRRRPLFVAAAVNQVNGVKGGPATPRTIDPCTPGIAGATRPIARLHTGHVELRCRARRMHCRQKRCAHGNNTTGSVILSRHTAQSAELSVPMNKLPVVATPHGEDSCARRRSSRAILSCHLVLLELLCARFRRCSFLLRSRSPRSLAEERHGLQEPRSDSSRLTLRSSAGKSQQAEGSTQSGRP